MIGLDRADVATALDRIGLPRALLSLRGLASPWIRVLTYHRVARVDDPTVLDRGVVDVTPEQLDRQLAFVTRWLHPIGIDDLLAYAAGRGALPPSPILITFDDGYRDNHDVALPILARHGVRATFFVATDYVERRRLYWWDRVSLVVGRCTLDRLTLEYPEHEALSLDTAQARGASLRRVQRIIKDYPGLDLERFLEALERAAGVVVSSDEERRLVEATIMTWDQVVALRRGGMDVQSHTHTHRVLQTLDAPDLDRELRLSKATLERVLGEPIRAVSYPVGKPLRDVPHVRRAVREAGYELGFSNASGTSRAKSFDPLDVRRVSLDVSMSDPFFRTMIALPWMAY